MQVANAVVLYVKSCNLRNLKTLEICYRLNHLAEPCVKLRQLFDVIVGKVERGEARQTSQLLHLESSGMVGWPRVKR